MKSQLNPEPELRPPIMNSTPDNLPMDTEDEESVLRRKLMLFGTDVGQIPCFRNSFLYGITGGIGTGIAHFAISSRVQSATKFGFYSYVGITLAYWCYCRYDYSSTKFQYAQLRYAMQQTAAKDGTSEALTRKKD